MKIGILTYHQAHFKLVQKHNYGAILQAYALKETLKELCGNAEVEVINYIPSIDNDKKYRRYLYRAVKANSFVLKVKTAIFLLFQFPKTYKRQHKIRKFIGKHLDLSPNTYQEFQENFDYDVFILGSDQIWNKGILGYYDNVLWGDFTTNKDAKIISYAASGAVRVLEKEDFTYIESNLNKMHAISVREMSFKNLLQPLTYKPISTTLDPTLLANPDIFNKIAKQPKIEGKYVLIYLLSDSNSDIRIVAEQIAKEVKAEIHIITFLNDKWISKKNIHETCSPEEFLGLFKHAEFVITNSFHGTAFSLIFQKEFLSFLSNQPKDERILSLLSKLELGHKAIAQKDNALFNWRIKTNWDSVLQRLNIEKQHSTTFLTDSIL
ncbi:MAG: polysaccharide pyruvyl transferase family protein [Bacteroidales bacterium]|nr:polysaccharide pyruvyl transferase family protein [Bacteroidales bacterium]